MSEKKLFKLNVRGAVEVFQKNIGRAEGDDMSALTEFVNWEVSSPTFSFTERETICVEQQNAALIRAMYVYLG